MGKQIANWRKSSHSSGNGGACVEVATVGAVLVRDTTDRGGVTLAMSTAAWARFTMSVKG
jgi:hypothetical protein